MHSDSTFKDLQNACLGSSVRFSTGLQCALAMCSGVARNLRQGILFAARCYVSAALAVMRCLCVCPSVTFVDSVKTNNLIVRTFSPSGSHSVLVLPSETAWQYSDGNPPPNGGVECRWDRQKSRF